MDTNALQQFKNVLGQSDRVGIVVGKNPTMDDMGAALALYLSLKATNKPVVIASATQPIVELSSLVGIDEVKPSLGGASGDLVVSFPYQEGEIEKVSYTIEGGFLNIVVKAGQNGLTFAEQDVRFTRGGGGLPTLLIVVGTAQLAALGELFNPEALKDTTIVNIDNKPDNQGFGDIVLVSNQYSSVSEVVANIILSNALSMDVDGAQNLMNGISFATNNFQSPQTSFYAFEIVAELMRRGAVRMPVAMPQQPMPSFMQQPQPQNSPMGQQMPRPSQMPRPQAPQGGQGMRQPFGGQQQRGGQQQQQQPRMGQRMNQPQQQRGGQQQQSHQQHPQQQTNRQDEIRRALAEQARQARMNQQMDQGQQQNQPQPQPQPMPQPQNVPQPPMPQPSMNPSQQGTQEAPSTDEAPSDWLTPKVYKGSTNIS